MSRAYEEAKPFYPGLGQLVRSRRASTTRKEELQFMATESREIARRLEAMHPGERPELTMSSAAVRAWNALILAADTLELEATASSRTSA